MKRFKNIGLQTCPCGNSKLRIAEISPVLPRKHRVYTVACPKCKRYGRVGYPVEEAVRSWNNQ